MPRDGDGRAIIADPRNDETIVIAGLQAAFLLFHNHVVDAVRAHQPELEPSEIFEQARRLTTWHYQWLIVHEFLPQLVGSAVVNDVLRRGPQFYRPGDNGPFIPVEFQIAYRFGHSMVRPSYRANFTGMGGGPLFAFCSIRTALLPIRPTCGACGSAAAVHRLADVLPIPRVRGRCASQQADR